AVHRETNAPIFYAQADLDSVYALVRESDSAEQNPRATPLLAFCGIGNPQAFVADLRSWGFEVVGHRFFQDHHRYTIGDIHSIEAEARSAGARGIICTEKDRFNLPELQVSLDLWVCAISLHIDRENEFWRTLMGVIDSRKAIESP